LLGIEYGESGERRCVQQQPGPARSAYSEPYLYPVWSEYPAVPVRSDSQSWPSGRTHDPPYQSFAGWKYQLVLEEFRRSGRGRKFYYRSNGLDPHATQYYKPL